MKVKDLIEQLQKLNQDADVLVAKYNHAETGDMSDDVGVNDWNNEVVIIDRS